MHVMCHFWLWWPSLTLEGARYGLLSFHGSEHKAAENTSNVMPFNLAGRHAARGNILSAKEETKTAKEDLRCSPTSLITC